MASEYQLNVVSNSTMTPHMRRIVLHGEDLAAFPPDQESGYVKLLLDAAGDAAKPVMRSYTIRRFDPDRRELTLDFVDHGDTGPATRWANHARAGDPIRVRGPGEKKIVDPRADWVLLAGDMSALPALAVNLEKLPATAKGHAIIEILSEEDRQPLTYPPGVEVQWLVNPDNEQPNTLLADAIRALPWLPGTPYPWFAGEFDAMRRVRRYFRDERGVDKRAMYVSCYWKIGDSDEGMKRAKRVDPEA